MKDLQDIKHDNDRATTREYLRLLAQVNELESILGLPLTANLPTWEELNRRAENLISVALSHIDPNDDGVQTEPIILNRS